MFETGLSLVLTIIIMTFYHHTGDRYPPRCMRKFVFGCLAPMVCMRSVVKDFTSGRVSPADDRSSLASILRQSEIQVDDLDRQSPKGKSQGFLPDDVIAYIRYLMEKEKDN